MVLVTGYLLVVLYSWRPLVTLGMGLFFLTFLVFDIMEKVLHRKPKDFAQAEILRDAFDQMNRDLFDNGSTARFTLFRPSPFRPNVIVAFYRYRKGVNDLIAEAGKSRVAYAKGEGFTGSAWEYAGNDLLWSSFPIFDSRKDLEEHYSKMLGVDEDTVREISDHMLKVRTILSYGLIGTQGQFLGVISIDLAEPIHIDQDNPFPKIKDRYLYSDTLAYSLRQITHALESFESLNR
jgi:hypothetical protein